MCRRMARGWDGLICLGQPGCVVFLWNIVWRGADSANPYRRCRYYTCILWVKQAENMAASLLITYESHDNFELWVKQAENMAGPLLITYES